MKKVLKGKDKMTCAQTLNVVANRYINIYSM